MKPKYIKTNILWGIGMIGLLGISYWLCRYSFFELHGMKQWPDLLALLSILIIVITTIRGSRIIPAATVAGYLGGFIFAMIFSIDGVDPGGGRTNNGWIIWGFIFIFSFLIGFILDFISKQKHDKVRK